MKTPQAILSAARPYTVILSVSVHMLIFLIPAAIVIAPQTHELELFVSIENLKDSSESAKTQVKMKKPQPEPVKEIGKPLETPRLKTEKPEMTGPIGEIEKELAEEAKEESLKVESSSFSPPVTGEDLRVLPDSVKMQMETKVPQPEPVKEIGKPLETLRLKTEKPEMTGPLMTAEKERSGEAQKESITVESKSIGQPTSESREGFFVSALPGRAGESSDAAGDRSIAVTSGVARQPSISHHVNGGDAGHSTETRFGDSVAPAFLHRKMPIYPLMARKLSREGRVVLKLTIDEKGSLLGIEVIEKADFGFTEAAVEAVKQSTFLPAKKNGRAIASRALLPIRFRIERN